MAFGLVGESVSQMGNLEISNAQVSPSLSSLPTACGSTDVELSAPSRVPCLLHAPMLPNMMIMEHTSETISFLCKS